MIDTVNKQIKKLESSGKEFGKDFGFLSISNEAYEVWVKGKPKTLILHNPITDHFTFLKLFAFLKDEQVFKEIIVLNYNLGSVTILNNFICHPDNIQESISSFLNIKTSEFSYMVNDNSTYDFEYIDYSAKFIFDK